jgi:hypothetical protein
LIITQKKRPARKGTEVLPAVFLRLYFFRRTDDEEDGREEEEELRETDDDRLLELEPAGRLILGAEYLELEDGLCLLMVEELLLGELIDLEL